MSLPLLLFLADHGSDDAGRNISRTRRLDTVAATDKSSAARDLRDDRLAARVRTGDTAALEILFKLYFPPLVRFAGAYVGDRDDAEELVADLFATIWARRSEWAPARVATYCYRAIRNRALNARRDRQLREQHHAQFTGATDVPGMSAMPDVTTASELDEQHRLLRDAMTRLTERQRTILTLRWEHELPWQTIADVIGTSVPAAKSEHTRALAALRAFFPRDRP